MALKNSQLAYDMTGNNMHRLAVSAHSPFAIGGYVNGAVQEYIWTEPQWRSFPNSYHMRINVTGEVGVGNFLDVETGDATPDLIPAWINSQLKQNDPLIIYCDRSQLIECLNERAKTKYHDKVFMCVATLDGTLVSNRAMTQFSQLRDTEGAYADVSIILNSSLINQMAARIGRQG